MEITYVREGCSEGRSRQDHQKSSIDSTSSAQSGHRMPVLGVELDELPSLYAIDELLNLDALQLERIKDTPHAYQMKNAAT